MNKVEQVGRAICRQQWISINPFSYNTSPELADEFVLSYYPNRKEIYEAMARAAIEALREPTEEMLIAAGKSPVIEDWKENMACNWQIMIDAALKE